MEPDRASPSTFSAVALCLLSACFQPDFNHPLDPSKPAGLIVSAMLSSKESTAAMGGLFMFITTDVSTGNVGGIAGADSRCNADAARPRQTGYKAMIADVAGNRRASQSPDVGDGQIDWVLRPSTRYLRSDGAFLVTTSAEGLIKSQLQAPLDATGSRQYWTALNSDWTTHGSDCTGWTDTAGTGAYGIGNSVTSGAIFSATQSCLTSTHLLCVEQ
ncbi:MAG: DUF1554 domain-containing protein [Spirochaetales bacterium]|nr:DUF1554 domain-containing protein [Spirochaetales bacterium]